MEFINQERLPAAVQKSIIIYGKELVKLLEDNILSIVVCGDVLEAGFVPGKTNINLILILRQIDVTVMRRCLRLVSQGQGKRIVAPLMLTLQHIETSLDTFPLEFSAIKDNHLTIYGKDLLNDLKIEKSDLRLQCEREIKGKLIHLRQGYLESVLKGNSLKTLLEISLFAILPILRGALRLCCTDAPPAENSAVIKMLSEKMPLDAELFMAVLRLREQKKSPPQTELETLLANYLIQLQKLAHLIDQMEVQ
ncbi:MAG: hypothetical protein HZA78_04480 [Candidatus Schekmanbacteria bacterium]|nr:hypothetical protein [Candidatus Schekmanbacteria bacterium]